MKTISLLFIISLFIYGAVTDESVTVNIGFSLTLHTNTIIQSNDVIEWRNKNELIAKLDRDSTSLFNGSDGRFRDRLKMNDQTGDLTITDITYKVIGLYHLQITGEKTTRKTFYIIGQGGFTDGVTSFSVMEGEFVRLDAGVPDRNNYDVIRWRFDNSPLAEINIKTEIISTHDERFRNRLKLDHWPGDLTISNITTDLSGLYQVNVDSNSGTHTIHQSYTLTVSDEVKSVSVMEGESVTLQIEVHDRQRGDKILWWFGPEETLIARISEDIMFNDADARFRNQVHLNQTGSLTITNITSEHSGRYDVKIFSSRRHIHRRFIVTVSDRSSGVRAGSCVGVLLVFVWSQIV